MPISTEELLEEMISQPVKNCFVVFLIMRCALCSLRYLFFKVIMQRTNTDQMSLHINPRSSRPHESLSKKLASPYSIPQGRCVSYEDFINICYPTVCYETFKLQHKIRLLLFSQIRFRSKKSQKGAKVEGGEGKNTVGFT